MNNFTVSTTVAGCIFFFSTLLVLLNIYSEVNT